MKPHERIFVALDTPDADRAMDLVRQLEGRVGGFKVGLELYSAAGPDVVRSIREHGMVFLDLKLHDIPNTVANAAAAVAGLGVDYFTMHASGGIEMMRRAVESARIASRPKSAPVALAVTVLTSHGDEDLETIGLNGPCSAAVLRLAGLAREAGAGGLVCSPAEIEAVRPLFPDGTLMVPGIRSGAAIAGDDQTRTASAGRAVASGADRLVIGRPITRAEDPVAAAAAIADEIEPSGANSAR